VNFLVWTKEGKGQLHPGDLAVEQTGRERRGLCFVRVAKAISKTRRERKNGGGELIPNRKKGTAFF